MTTRRAPTRHRRGATFLRKILHGHRGSPIAPRSNSGRRSVEIEIEEEERRFFSILRHFRRIIGARRESQSRSFEAVSRKSLARSAKTRVGSRSPRNPLMLAPRRAKLNNNDWRRIARVALRTSPRRIGEGAATAFAGTDSRPEILIVAIGKNPARANDDRYVASGLRRIGIYIYIGIAGNKRK